jgi:lipoate-protein ligase B
MWCVYTNRTSQEAPFSFSDLLTLQQTVLRESLAQSKSAMLFAEVNPTVTVGARQVHDESQKNSLQSLSEKLKTAGVEVVAGGRGGKETWHGPGQWVVFLVTPLVEFSGDPRGVRKAVCKILDSVLTVVQKWVPEARMEEDARLGIWSARGKLVSVGIKITEGYVTSGFALNCIPTPQSFFGIAPCGLEGEQADFLFADRLAEKKWAEAFQSIPAQILTQF